MDDRAEAMMEKLRAGCESRDAENRKLVADIYEGLPPYTEEQLREPQKKLCFANLMFAAAGKLVEAMRLKEEK